MWLEESLRGAHPCALKPNREILLILAAGTRGRRGKSKCVVLSVLKAADVIARTPEFLSRNIVVP